MTENREVWTGHASAYDQVRPAPPAILLDLLTQLIVQPRPALVVDLGSGTGLSTAIWSERAEQVIGIEPNADMHDEAIRNAADHPNAVRISYREGTAQQTGLADACADIVTCSQAFHWMEPGATLAEIARILRPGGVFAAYDYDTPPTTNWELDRAALEVTQRIAAIVRDRGLAPGIQIWPKDQHLANMRASGHYRFTREVALHHVERGDAARYVAMMRSNAFSAQYQFSDQEIGLDRLSDAANQMLGSNPIPWYWSYRVRIGVK